MIAHCDTSALMIMRKVWDPFLEQVDRRVVDLWELGDWKTFCAMLLGWDAYAAPVEVVTPTFGGSGTGQINAVFPVTPLAVATT